MSGIDLSDVSVALIMPFRSLTDVSVPTMDSMIRTVQALHEYGVPYEIHFHVGDLLPWARSWAAHRFLKSKMNRAFWLDSDIGWNPEDFMKLLAWSTLYNVIGASYRAKRDTPFYLMHTDHKNVVADERGCIKIVGMGLGFTCMRRHVLEELAARAPIKAHIAHPEPFAQVFRFGDIDNVLQGEDMAFFEDVRALGYDVTMDPSIELGHLGSKVYSGRFSDILTKGAPPAPPRKIPGIRLT